MEELLVNEKLKLPVYDSFHVLDEEERKSMTFLAEGPCVCLADPDRHMTVTVGWKPAGGLASLLLNAKDIARSSEKAVSAAMWEFGYRNGGFLSRKIAG